jgi:hypothetical protein
MCNCTETHECDDCADERAVAAEEMADIEREINIFQEFYQVHNLKPVVRKPVHEPITDEEYDFLASIDSNGGFC